MNSWLIVGIGAVVLALSKGKFTKKPAKAKVGRIKKPMLSWAVRVYDKEDGWYNTGEGIVMPVGSTNDQAKAKAAEVFHVTKANIKLKDRKEIMI